jgi:HEAT repeat protein
VSHAQITFMNRLLIPIALLAGLALPTLATAHGGVYIGPGDTVPPGAGIPTPPTPPSPTDPPTGTTPGTPPTPTIPTAPGTGGPPAPPALPPTSKPPAVTGIGDFGVDLNRWEFWWEFNKGPYLNLKAKILSGATSTGESDIMTGLGRSRIASFAPTPAAIKNTIIPQLRKLMLTADDREITGGGMIALAKIQLDPTVLQIFIEHLSSADQEIEETAALAMGILQNPEAFPILLDLATDTVEGRKLVRKPNGVPARTRAFAIYGMGLLGNRTDNPTLQQAIADQLWQILSTDQSGFKDLRTASIISMGVVSYQDPTVPVNNLLAYLKDANNDTLVRAHCPNAIAKILWRTGKYDPSNPLIARATQTFATYCRSRFSKNEIEQSCVYSLGMLVNASDAFQVELAYDAIRQVAEKSKNKQAQRYSSIAMAYLGARVAADSPYLEKSLKFLMEGLRNGKGGRDSWSGLSLGIMGFMIQELGRPMPSLVERSLLEKFKQEKNPQRRGAYAVALGLIHSEIAAPALRAAIDESRDEGLQGYACLSLGMIGANQYKDDLVQIVRESVRKPDLLKQASIALGLMKDKSVSKVLLQLIQPENGRKPSLAVLAAAATALGFIGDRSSVEPLIASMNDQKSTDLSRAFSAVALGAVAEVYALPWNSIFSVDLNYRASVQTLTNQNSGVLDIK